MKKVILASALLFLTIEASAESNNDAIGRCWNFYKPNISLASQCAHAVAEENERAAFEKRQLFLNANPWYKGPKWNWEECARDKACTNSIIRRY